MAGRPPRLPKWHTEFFYLTSKVPTVEYRYKKQGEKDDY